MSAISLLNFPTFENGKGCDASYFNALVGKTNELVEWVNEYKNTHGTSFDISNATVVGISEKYSYTGEAITPSFRVYDTSGTLLVAGKDYDFQFESNVDKGTASLVLYGIGGYYVNTKTVTFVIEGTKYNVTYSTDKGTAPSTRKTSVLTASDIPTLTGVTGYTNTGWYYDPAYTSQANAGDDITKDVTLYAKWVASTFTLTYSTAKGSVTQPADKVSVIPTLPTPTATGYKFLGWFYADGTEAKAGDTLTADTTLTAKWIAVTITQTLDASNNLSLVADETTLATTIEYSTDGGTTWTEYSSAIALTATTTVLARLKYEGTVVSEAQTITMQFDADNNTLTFTSSVSGATITVTGATATEGVVSLADITTDTTITVTDGTTTATVEVDVE